MHTIENMTYDMFFIFGFIAGVVSSAIIRIVLEWRESKSRDIVEKS